MTILYSEIFERAADNMERYGHARGRVGRAGMSQCAVGHVCNAWRELAINEMPSDILDVSTRFEKFVMQHVDDFLFRDDDPIKRPLAQWSDAAATQEVLDLFRKAAKAERIQEEATSAPSGAEVLQNPKGSVGTDAGQ